jgi:hypothetical protein
MRPENGWLELLMAEAKKARAVGFNHVAIEVDDIEEATAVISGSSSMTRMRCGRRWPRWV